MAKNKLGKFLKEHRIHAGLTQWEVADHLGYSSAQFISNFERGLCSPPLNQLKNIVDLYEMNPDKLVEIMMEERLHMLEKSVYGRARKSRKKKS